MARRGSKSWRGSIRTGREVELAWAIVGEMSVRGARLLEPVFEATGGRKGRLSMQTDPTLFGSAERMLQQAAGFVSLAPNVIVKFPATAAGLAAIEEATARGISVNVTVCFTVAAGPRGGGRDRAGPRPTRVAPANGSTTWARS